jgi:beta-lactamase superfamily II metal-dependent hydrolase
MFRIDLLPAQYGDAIWIEYGSPPSVHRLLIDCGTSEVYPCLRQRLLALPEGQRHFELLVVTHVDADHIGGALDLLREREIIGVSFGEIWFNGYVHLTAGGVVPRAQDEDLLGPLQGEVLTELIVANGAQQWNAAVHGGALVVPESGPLQPLLRLPGGMRLTLLSPAQAQLDRLKPVWDAACRKAGIVAGAATAADSSRLDEVDEPTEDDDLLGEPEVSQLAALPFKPDRARPNGSSIALLAEYDGQCVVLAGDAFAEVLLDALARLPGNAGGGLRLEAFKMSHHGSRGNTSAELVRAVSCRNWLISTNGEKFGHPNGEAIARVLRGGAPDLHLYFNYRSEFNDLWSSSTLQRKHGYAAHYPANNGAGMTLELSTGGAVAQYAFQVGGEK